MQSLKQKALKLMSQLIKTQKIVNDVFIFSANNYLFVGIKLSCIIIVCSGISTELHGGCTKNCQTEFGLFSGCVSV